MSDSSTDAGYRPRPIDTANAELPPELEPLLEHLARNAHEAWALQRLRDGWALGAARDDVAKRHPDLVPFEQLPESEREYDRIAAGQTLRAILAMGYSLVPPSARTGQQPESRPRSDDDDETAARIAACARARDLIGIWQTNGSVHWASRPGLCAKVARRFLQLGQPLLAREVLREPRALRPDDLTLRHLDGLALARSGATMLARDEAAAITRALGPTLGDHAPDLYEDAYGLLARVSKDLALDQDDADRRRRHLLDSLAAYEQAFAVTGRPYSAINAATVALLLGDAERSASLARAARAATHASMQQRASHADLFWQSATLGEAALLVGDLDDAVAHYREAADCSRAIGLGDIANTRRQARLIASHRGYAADWVDDVLPAPAVVIFAGPRPDASGRRPSRFPAEAEPRVRAALREALVAMNARVGFSGAAPGSDILFQEVMRELGGETHVVLPYGEPDAADNDPPPAGWRGRAREVIDAATECVVATDRRSIDDRVLVRYQHELVLGLAAIQARRLDARLTPLALHDRHELPTPRDRRHSGTAAVIAAWRRAGYRPRILDLGEITRRGPEVVQR